MVICQTCDGGGQRTADQFMMTYKQLQAEIDRDYRSSPGQVSRTQIAIDSGILKFEGCPSCNGDGLVEV